MTRIQYEIPIDRPAADVWAVVSDFGGVHRYNPNVRASRLTSDGPNGGIGATRHCDLTFPGATVEERIRGWHDGAGYALEIYEGAKMPPFEGAPRAAFALRPSSVETCVLTASLAYEMRLGAIGHLMDVLLVRRKFATAFAGLAAGVKHHAETGALVDATTDLSRETAAIRVSTDPHATDLGRLAAA